MLGLCHNLWHKLWETLVHVLEALGLARASNGFKRGFVLIKWLYHTVEMGGAFPCLPWPFRCVDAGGERAGCFLAKPIQLALKILPQGNSGLLLARGVRMERLLLSSEWPFAITDLAHQGRGNVGVTP